MTYFSRSIAIPLAAILVGGLFALPVLAHGDDDDAVTRVASVLPAAPSLAVFIGPNGSVLVRGAKVTAESGATLSAETAWGSTNITWTLHTSASTAFSGFSGSGATSSAIAVGDIVSFRGALDRAASSAFTVNATAIRDWSKNAPDQKPLTVSGSGKGSVSSGNGWGRLLHDFRLNIAARLKI